MRAPLTILAILLAAGPAPAVASDGTPPADADVWPGYVPGGQFYRNLQWGVSFYGPGQADQQFLPAQNLLVRYSVQAQGGEPGWVVSAVTATVKQEMDAARMLAASAAQLRQRMGNRVQNIRTDPGRGEHAVGQLTCTIRTGSGSGGVEQRTYFYFRLREKQYLTFVGSTTPGGADELGKILQAMSDSLAVFDPQAENRQLSEAADRTGKLIAAADVNRFNQLAAGFQAQWLRAYRIGDDRKPEPTGWGYVNVSREGAGILAVASFKLTRGDETLRTHQAAYVDLSGGAEWLREWSRVTAANTQPSETRLTATRRGAAFDVSETATGQQAHNYEVKIAGSPYLPTALQGLLPQLAAGGNGQLFGAFGYSPTRSTVLFQTLQNAGPARAKAAGRTLDARRWLSRSSTSLPVTVRYTTPDGSRILREEFSPNEWAEAVDESAVPADVRRELIANPQ